MATNYAVRITRAWSAIERAIHAIALRCDKVLAYEHVGSATEKVHVHLILIGVRCDVDTLKNDMKRNGLATLKGNGEWSFKTKDKKYGDVEDSPKYITYMTKGQHDPKYNKGYTQEELDQAKSNWVERSNKSKAEIEYWAFDALVPKDLPPEYEMVNGKPIHMPYRAFKEVRRRAMAYAMEKLHVMTPACKNMIQMLYKTYCYKHNIEMDPQFDKW